MKLGEIAKVIRSKNAGPFKLTLDLLFEDEEAYRKVKNSGAINRKMIAALYKIKPEDVEGIFFIDEVLGIKITFLKKIPSDDPACEDVYGAQQHVPLLDLEL